MAIPIIYVTTRKPRGLDRMQGPMFVLAYDAWNDYSYQTMFSAYRIDKGGDRLIGSVRILYEGQTTEIATSELLQRFTLVLHTVRHVGTSRGCPGVSRAAAPRPRHHRASSSSSPRLDGDLA